ncbi:MAG: O-antigen ligase family protein [Candidatus Omnitrophica bacterium]|nr:O-antigen ligase family protein [Candidatus Omnitrophota bacterium]MBU1869163.1 O-antigen ligase family protein [Candidatus Omnitrophota bacterium]
MKRFLKVLDFIVYWSIVLLPFADAIAPAPMNVFMGYIIGFFLIKKLLRKERIFIKTGVFVPILLLFAVTCLSAINSVDLADTFRGGIGRLAHYALLFFVLVEEIKDKKHVQRIVISCIAGVLLACIDSVWQVLAGKDFIQGIPVIMNIGLARATASFKDSNILGVYLSAFTPIILGLSLYYFKGKAKAWMLLISAIALLGSVLTYSRPTLLAVYISLFILSIFKKDKIMIIALVVLTFLAPFIAPKPVKQWAKNVDYNVLRFMCNDDRIAVYRNSLLMIKAHPFIGVGANGFMNSYKYYKESPEYRAVVTLDEMKAHNNFLHMAGEIGITGLLVFIWFLYGLFRHNLSIYKNMRDDFLKIISLSLFVCLLAFLINGLTESSLYYSRVGILFWYLAGFSLSLKKFCHAE